jgi:hypothetical protein
MARDRPRPIRHEPAYPGRDNVPVIGCSPCIGPGADEIGLREFFDLNPTIAAGDGDLRPL